MLNTYILQTQQLLQNPAAPVALYSTADLTTYINRARQQLAGEAQCVRVYSTMPTVAGVERYQFGAINVPVSVEGVFNIRTMWSRPSVGEQRWLQPRPFEWFSLYVLNRQVALPPGIPTQWAQYSQGEIGSFFVDPVPNSVVNLVMDTACIPIELQDDNDPEVIPFPFTDAVPFFAAYYALLSAQAPARQADAERMMQRYQEFLERARRISTPEILPFQNPQTVNPFWQAVVAEKGAAQ